MCSTIEQMLAQIEEILDEGLDAPATERILKLLGVPAFPVAVLDEMLLYEEHLPKAEEFPLTPGKRFLHFLWDTLDRTPMGLATNFAMPFRRMIGERLFKRCGRNLVADENVRFNFGHNIELGDDVLISRGVFLDGKGGISIGNYAGLAENVVIFTHGHSESLHSVRTYGRVVLEDYAKVYSNAMILPGVTVGQEGIVGAKSLVGKDVPAGMLAVGNPAHVVRERRNEGRHGLDLDHYWLRDGAYQLCQHPVWARPRAREGARIPGAPG
jgi:acetyltransferase-like isoleucine patch superfamily enzyme